ncbi:zinc finger protein 383-like [Contarinia nasturtii]|uniref:zinc finger protein 383-like n=1 Tax=Contarinia nasturtii TaxID=265458 RepID=UPI0012D3E2A8|nr:zinc finger protein 383-like [Contarinia nasturtii]
MDIFCICRTCLNEPSSDLISIYSPITPNQVELIESKNDSETQISSILDELTGNTYSVREFPYPDKICELCLAALKAAFQFRQQCEITFKELKKLSKDNSSFNELQPPLEVKPILIEPELHILTSSANDLENILASEEEELSQCKKVKNETSDIANIFDDEPTEIKSSTYQCEHCGKSFGRKTHLRRHMNVHQSKDLRSHMTSQHGDRILQSKGMKLATDKKINKVEKPQKIISSAYQCDHCDKVFTRKTHLRRHMTIHTDERAYGCKICDKRFRRRDHLKIHENYHAKIRPHICEHCQRSFSRTEHLRRHVASRHSNKTSTFSCKNCEYVATSVKELNQHRKSHAEVSFACKTCDLKFTTKSEHTEHTKVHSDERPFLCSECGMRFIRNDYLVIHMRRHTGEKPYKCRFCERAFPRTTDLTVHERYHTNEKKHICSVCGKGFQRAYNLTVHTRVHTKEKPYQCPHCSKSFSQGNDLKAHIRRHTGERYQCELCSSSFIQIYLLNNHKKNVHGISATSNISRVAKFEPTSQHVIPTSHIENETDCTVYTV